MLNVTIVNVISIQFLVMWLESVNIFLYIFIFILLHLYGFIVLSALSAATGPDVGHNKFIVIDFRLYCLMLFLKKFSLRKLVVFINLIQRGSEVTRTVQTRSINIYVAD